MKGFIMANMQSNHGDKGFGIHTLSLNKKFAIVIILIVAVPTILFSTALFQSIKNNIIENRMKDIENTIDENTIQIERNIEMCNMTTQMLVNNNQLKDYLYDLKNGKTFTDNEIFHFYRTDITAVQKMAESNPYLYKTRIFVNSKLRMEKIPLLYRQERMKNLDWYRHPIQKAFWSYDYEDSLFPIAVAPYQQHVMALITPIKDDSGRVLAVSEVSIVMEKLFPRLYNATGNFWSCYVDPDGNYYYDNRGKWKKNKDEIVEIVKNHRDENCFSAKINGESVVIAHSRVNGLHGKYIQVESLKGDLEGIMRFRFLFLSGLLLLLLLLAIAVNQIVHVMLKQFYEIMRVLHVVENGDLDATVTLCTSDEMGEMAVQINRMLVKIKGLMSENINRELLVKNSEIRALQNQINAHFIYNVLESIKMMAEIREEYDIADAVTSLGKLLRYSMKWVSKNVTIEEEVEYIKNYIALLNLRFDYEIYLSINMPEVLWKQEIPKMSLQPVIENAVYHGIEDIAEDTSIYMKGIVFDTYFQIEITDSGKGMSEEQVRNLYKKISGEIETTGGSGNGIGLKNVQDRIRISFGPEYGLSFASREGCFTKVMMKIPWKEGTRK